MDTKRMRAYVFVSMGPAKHRRAAIFRRKMSGSSVFLSQGTAIFSRKRQKAIALRHRKKRLCRDTARSFFCACDEPEGDACVHTRRPPRAARRKPSGELSSTRINTGFLENPSEKKERITMERAAIVQDKRNCPSGKKWQCPATW